jgi:tRNA (guanine37-N1)-methyltransferase
VHIHIVTLFPEMFEPLQHGVIGRAQRKNLLNLHYHNPRDFTHDVHHTVDDRPYGGGPGMVMKFEPLQHAIQQAKLQASNAPVILLSPQGKPLTQTKLQQFANLPQLILVAGRYEGIDERFIETFVDEECSIGDYVLSGGEIPAMVVIDGITRLLPHVLNDEQSAEQDSFSQGLLDHPHYTRPEEIIGKKVPDVLLGGNHQAIARWRLKQSLGKTWQKRPDLIKMHTLSKEELALLDEFIQDTHTKKFNEA